MKTTKKGKKTKKSKGGKSKDSWTHEGGVVYDDDTQGRGKEMKRGFRRTQEVDERQRRGRMKGMSKIQTMQFKKKMSKKIKFSDVLEESESEPEPEPKVVKVQKRSNKTPMQRLRNFLKPEEERDVKGFNSNVDEIEDDEGSEQSDEYEFDYPIDYEDQGSEDEEGDEGDGDDDEKDGASSSKVSKQTLKQWDVDETAVEAVDNHEELFGDEDELTHASHFRWFFSSVCEEDAAAAATDAKTPALLASERDLAVFGKLSKSEKVKFIKHLSDVAGLPKLWRSRQSTAVPDSVQSVLLSYLLTYGDLFFDGRDYRNDDSVIDALSMHACIHMVRSKIAVMKHNQKMKHRVHEAVLAAATTSGDGKRKDKKRKKDEVEMKLGAQESVEGGQDQGYCTPRILIMCPTRGAARRIVGSMRRALGANTTVSGAAKFDEEFGYESDDDDEEDEEEEDDEEDGEDEDEFGNKVASISSKASKRKKRNRRKAALKAAMPADWQSVFRDNADDDFKMGIQINPGQGKGAGADKGVYMRLYSDYYAADVIVASPLGLRLVVDSSNGKLNFDFLSSIEMVVLHQADVMYMQNWEHVEYILAHTNMMPTQDHGTDFARVRPYFLEGKAAQHRQLIVTSEFNSPDIQASLRQYGKSLAGTLRVRRVANEVPLKPSHTPIFASGTISEVCCTKLAQVFQRVPCPKGFAGEDDSRFQYFCDNVLSQIIKTEQKRTLIFAPSYFSFIRIRNELIRREVEAVCISEYSRESEISRGRSRFYHGQMDIMLYSGRAHFFRRFRIRGVANVVFYSVPDHAAFYPEILNSLSEAEQIGFCESSDEKAAKGVPTGPIDVSSLVLFTQYERMALERVVGTARSEQMLTSQKNSFMFR